MENENKNIVVLNVSDLTIGYTKNKQTNCIAKDINFNLKKGSLVGLVGVNGIGKSTLLKTLSKVEPCIKGHVYFQGEDLNQIDESELAKKLSIVFSGHKVNNNLSVWELVALGRHPYTNWIGTLHDKDLHIINEALKITQIDHLKDKKTYELSDGQFQKMMLARALAQDTNIIILDEPTSHLDMYHKAYILQLLKRLTRETDKTILFSTHEINMALSICDQLIVMKPNSTIFGSPIELIQQKTLHDLFPKDLVFFDPNSKSFKIK